jgi:hypothetical protein
MSAFGARHFVAQILVLIFIVFATMAGALA